MLNALMAQYRRRQKLAMLKGPGEFRQGYAFAGVGAHSLQNLYPVLQHLGVPLRWIQSRTLAHAQLQSARFPGSRPTGEIGDILNDPEVKAVFICAPPAQQFSFAKACLEAGKHVWMEKPAAPDLNGLDALIQLAGQQKRFACMGVQRRHAPALNLLRRKMKSPMHFALRYVAGAHPEGDVLTELFIHPLDLVIILFGEVKDFQLTRVQGNGGETLLLQTQHEKGIAGQIELSTLHDWQRSEEVLTVNTPGGLWRAENNARLTFEPRAAKPFGIPLEKVLSRPAVTETWFEASRFLPQMVHQPLYVQGFHDELRAFTDLVEGRQQSAPQELREMRALYDWIGKIRKA